MSGSATNGHIVETETSLPLPAVVGARDSEAMQPDFQTKRMGLSEYVEEELSHSSTRSSFQLRYTIYLGLPWLLCGMQTMLHIFVTLPPQRRVCLGSATAGSGLANQCTDIAVDNCTVPEELFEYVAASRTLVAEFGLICDEEYKVPLLSTGFFLGFLFGVGFFAAISDNRGRKTALTFGLAVMQIGALLAVVAPTYSAYAAARLLIGAGVGGIGLTSFVWNSEVLGPQSRCILAATSNGIFAVGILLLPVLATFVPGWRMLSACIFLLGLPVGGLCCLEESPKWLASAGRSEEAHIVLLRIAAANKLEPPAAPPIAKEEASVALPQAAGGTSVLQELLCDRRLSRRFVVMCFTWFALSVGYFGLSMSVSNLGWDVNLAVFISQLTELPVYLPAIPLVDSRLAGRRGTTASSLLLAGVCCLLAAAATRQPTETEEVSASREPSVALIILVYVGKAGIALAFTVVYLYAAELFPTDIRSRAMGLQSLCSRVGGMMAPIIADVGKHSMSLALVLFGAPSLLSGLMLLGLPETRGARIPDSIEDVPEPLSLSSSCFHYEHLDEQPMS